MESNVNKILNKSEKFNNYIPYAFHYNHQSILTKNGELIIVIKLENQSDNLYKKIILDCFNKPSFAPYTIWITTINEEFKQAKFSKKDSDQGDFLNKLDEIFSINTSEKKFFQEIYLSFVFNDDVNISDFKFNLFSFISFSQRNYNEKLSKLFLNSMIVVSNFLYQLKKYKARVLSIIEENQIFYCEILSFFSKINFIQNNDERIQLGANDLSIYLHESNNFNYKILNQNTIKIKNLNKAKFCSAFSIKCNQNRDFNLLISNQLLDCDFEFVSTEILMKSQKKQILKINEKSYNEYKKKISQQAENFDFIENNSLLKKFLNSSKLLEKENKNDNSLKQNFFLKKNIFFIKADSEEDLSVFSKNIFLKFSSFGIQFIRENIFLDQIFWSQMPGNFNFLDRIKISENANALFFNSFNKTSSLWINFFIFKNKINNSINKINLKNKKFFFFFEEDESPGFLLLFLINFIKKFSLKINYVNQDDKILKIIKKNFLNSNLKEKHKISNNLSLDFISEIEEIDRKKRIKEIFNIILPLIKIFWFSKIFSFKNQEDNILQNNEIDQIYLRKIKNLAKQISIQINLNISNVKKVDFEKIIQIFSSGGLFSQYPEISKNLKSLYEKEANDRFIIFYKNFDFEKINKKFLLIFILIKILQRYLMPYYSLSLESDLIFIIDIDDSFLMEFENFNLILNELFLIMQNYNVFLVFNLKKINIKNILKIYDNSSKESIFFATGDVSKRIIQILNPNFNGNKNFFEDFLLIINDLKFIFNEFPEKQLKDILEIFYE